MVGATAVGAAGAMAAGAMADSATVAGETVASAMADGGMVGELAGAMVVPESPFAGKSAVNESTNLPSPLNCFHDEY